jgi:8-oxo-dGTP pyrophosphatase MutT (NUDIX family)
VQYENIILCRAKGKKWFFLPGGHIEDGESAREALLRELEEELGESGYKISSFIGMCENIFSMDKNTLHHEFNVIFEVGLPKDFVAVSKEEHLEFIAIRSDEINDYDILPSGIKDGVIEWIANRRPFFKEL